MGSQQFCLRWNNYKSNMVEIFDELLNDETFVDVTLACEGKTLKAHKMILSACSPFFKDIFKNNPCQHPVIILKDTNFSDLKTILNFMYHGEVNVSQNELGSLLKMAESLQIKGLADANKSQDADDAEFELADTVANFQMQSPESVIRTLPRQQSNSQNHRKRPMVQPKQTIPTVPTQQPKPSQEGINPIEVDISGDDFPNIKEEIKNPNCSNITYPTDMLQTSTMDPAYSATDDGPGYSPMDPSHASNYDSSQLTMDAADVSYDENIMMPFQEDPTMPESHNGYNYEAAGQSGQQPDGSAISLTDNQVRMLLMHKRRWKESDMEKAVEAVRKLGWKLPQAVRTYNVPLTTLWRRLRTTKHDTA